MSEQRLLQYAIVALSFMWVWTGVTSIFLAPEVGYTVLSNAGIDGRLADFSVYCGALADIVIGLWLLTAKYRRTCLLIQMLLIVTYTLLLTIIDFSFWLHPFGPVSKNLPILVLIALVYNKTPRAKPQS